MTATTALTWLLRSIGILLLLAVFAVVAPFAWMATLHRALRLAELPDLPIVHYLTRSSALLYANWGILYVYLSLDVARHRTVIRFLMLTKLVFAAAMLAIDLAAAMPWYWTILEGPPIALLALTIYLLARPSEFPSFSEKTNVLG